MIALSCDNAMLCGINVRFQTVSRSVRQIAHVLLTRPPLSYPGFRPKTSSKITPFDLHVLGVPPAFILSQDQTLNYSCILKRSRALKSQSITDALFLVLCLTFFQLLLLKAISQGFCISFYCSIFKLLSAPSQKALDYCITSDASCQYLFWTFFQKFLSTLIGCKALTLFIPPRDSFVNIPYLKTVVKPFFEFVYLHKIPRRAPQKNVQNMPAEELNSCRFEDYRGNKRK